ncbi:probable site-specific DNA-methyltransferase (adenine-specific) [Thermoplasma acidophilum]|uniref:site-specific DNA-methyltransferase (adenine-specific) n=1 Tax=Thermoplasma acidophilum (strain ATCC 25905 / DSM 1728 / JCM 9062 / NBRC 15155 / AMRC-C165) TaxID=273075 RepID=Q9HKF7_THEAC|nr:probable site-specific DNA-methyltransferase (adenine-specific) [Thermoplasma acidophilum]
MKWAGGKRQLLPILLKYSPAKFNTYYEPFIGGAALLISLYSLNKIKSAVVSDTNKDLYNLYKTMKENPLKLIAALKDLKFKNNREDYYEARSLFNSTEDPVKRSALLIYLNRHGYNGLYRVNSENKFNVPFGRYSNPRMPSSENIMAFSNILKSCTILNLDFEMAVSHATRGDFVYFDPPYMPLNRTSYFTEYTNSGFDEKDQERLFRVYYELSKRGVYVMESNSSTEFIKELYKDFCIIEVDAKRNINSIGNRRNGIKELIITNYDV